MTTRTIPLYRLGEIPDQVARGDDSLTFQVDTTNLGSALQMSVEHQPQGEIHFEPSQGKFEYLPASQDTQAFQILFSTGTGDRALSQTVTVTPLPSLPNPRTYVVSYPTPPDPTSSLYFEHTFSTNQDKSVDRQLCGVTLLFEPGHANNLYKEYSQDRGKKIAVSPDPRDTLRELTLCADRVVIHGELNLPETQVKIFARELVFEDRDGQTACINTTPLEYELKKALDAQPPDRLGTNGVAGRTGGSLSLYVHQIVIPGETSEAKRFVLNGGSGQAGGNGKDSKLMTPPLMPGLGGSGGVGGALSVRQDLLIKSGASGEAIKQSIDALVDNRGGLNGAAGSFLGFPLLFKVSHDDVYKDVPMVGYISAALRQAFERIGLPLGEDSYMGYTQMGPWGYSPVPPQLWSESLHLTLYDRRPLVAQFNFGRYREAFTQGSLPAEFRPWLADWCKQGEKHLPDKYRALTEHYGALVPGEQTLVICEDEWIATNPNVHELNRRVEKRWWIIDLTTQAAWAVESLASYPERASLYLVKRYSLVNDEKQKEFRVFNGGMQPCFAVPPEGIDLLDRGVLPPTLKQEIVRHLHVGLAESVRPAVLWQSHVWQIQVDNKAIYLNAQHKKPSREAIAVPVAIVVSLMVPHSVELPSGTLRGAQPSPTTITPANCWLHPAQLRTSLDYVRDAYLCERRHELLPLLAAYQQALVSPPVASSGWVDDYQQARYHSHATEVTNLVHRLHSHLDYYGNPAGWAPLLSLQACLRIYQKELDRSLRTLLLIKWIERRAHELVDANTAMEGSIQTLGEESQAAARVIGEQENAMDGLHARVQGLQAELIILKEDLKRRRDELRRKAEKNVERKAWLDMAFGTFSAICSVIPVGQPALGAVGSLSNVVKDMATGEDPLEGVGRIAGILGKASASWLDDKAAAVVKEAEADPATLRKKESADRLKHVSQTMGPALAEISSTLKGLQVPRDEVEREMARLAASDPAFQDLVQRIETNNNSREAFCRELDATIQAITGAYQRIADNSVAVAKFERHRGEMLARLDHDALRHVRDMGQRAQHMLIKYLYFVVKSYEGTLLEAVEKSGHNIDFRLTKVFDKIDELTAGDAPLDFTKLPAYAEVLRPIFEDNLAEIERALLERYLWSGKERWANDPAPECRLSEDNTPEIIRQLNTEGEAVINLKQLGLLPPAYERMRILHVEIIKDKKNRPEFDHPPKEGTVRIVLEALDDGTIRSEGKLYVVRHPTQSICGWAYHFSDNSLELGEKSRSSVALLRELLEQRHGRADEIDIRKSQIYDYIAPSPAWSNVRIRYDRSDLVAKGIAPPEIKSLLLRWHFDVIRANDAHRVLDVRTFASGDAKPLIACDQKDLGGNNDGYGDLYRIYPKGATVTLTAPLQYGELEFSHWTVHPPGIIAKGSSPERPQVTLTLGYDAQVFCFFASQEDILRHPLEVRATLTQLHRRGRKKEKFVAVVGVMPMVRAEALPNVAPEVRNQASLTHGVLLSYLPDTASFTVLDGPIKNEGLTWYQVDHLGSVGWVRQQ